MAIAPSFNHHRLETRTSICWSAGVNWRKCFPASANLGTVCALFTDRQGMRRAGPRPSVSGREGLDGYALESSLQPSRCTGLTDRELLPLCEACLHYGFLLTGRRSAQPSCRVSDTLTASKPHTFNYQPRCPTSVVAQSPQISRNREVALQAHLPKAGRCTRTEAVSRLIALGSYRAGADPLLQEDRLIAHETLRASTTVGRCQAPSLTCMRGADCYHGRDVETGGVWQSESKVRAVR